MAAAGEEHLQALECLYQVIDPELGINIVDLGLVYSLELRGDTAYVDMTMTTPACPLHGYLASGVETAILESMPRLRSVDVHLTFDPPWDPAMMSGAAKHALGW
ncbi:MAG: metal-sulfur cluster assembly factor [Chloroflexi bacterium]|nr:metal-sulfur cluster assembly factor [Chloroflexota bacterium]